MPTYKNNTPSPVAWKGNHWRPGEERSLGFFVPCDQLGLTKTSDEPAIPPLILVEGITRTIEAGVPLEIDIPYPSSGYVQVSILQGEGTCRAFLGGGSAAAQIGPGDYFRTLPWERCNKIRLESTEGATVQVLVEDGV